MNTFSMMNFTYAAGKSFDVHMLVALLWNFNEMRSLRESIKAARFRFQLHLALVFVLSLSFWTHPRGLSKAENKADIFHTFSFSANTTCHHELNVMGFCIRTFPTTAELRAHFYALSRSQQIRPYLLLRWIVWRCSMLFVLSTSKRNADSDAEGYLRSLVCVRALCCPQSDQKCIYSHPHKIRSVGKALKDNAFRNGDANQETDAQQPRHIDVLSAILHHKLQLSCRKRCCFPEKIFIACCPADEEIIWRTWTWPGVLSCQLILPIIVAQLGSVS